MAENLKTKYENNYNKFNEILYSQDKSSTENTAIVLFGHSGGGALSLSCHLADRLNNVSTQTKRKARVIIIDLITMSNKLEDIIHNISNISGVYFIITIITNPLEMILSTNVLDFLSNNGIDIRLVLSVGSSPYIDHHRKSIESIE